MPHAQALDQLRDRVQAVIDAHLAAQREILTSVGPATGPLLEATAGLLRGGKRLRALFFYWGYRSVGGADSSALVRAATSMEMFQAAALIHDDVMDDSETRRGAPSVHRRVASLHAERGWHGDHDRFGMAAAVLAGDLCLTWTDELYAASGLPDVELARGRATFDAMRNQLMGGQFLDVLEAAVGWESADTQERLARARHVALVKSARYTVEQPLLIGAACAGTDDAVLSGLADYGRALGEAFQQRDDLLGVFGDPVATGKPAGDDLREGKRTVLMAHTLDRLELSEVPRFEAALGRADLPEAELSWMRQRIEQVGAVAQVEDLILDLAERSRAALAALPDLDARARGVLEELIGVTTDRRA